MSNSVWPFASIFWLAFAALVSAATIWDALSYRIPNMLVAALAGTALAAIFLNAPARAADHLTVGGAALVIGYLLYRFTGLGAGDAKLLSAVMLWSGSPGLAQFMFWCGITSGTLVVVLVLGREIVRRGAPRGAVWAPLERGAPVPFGLAIGPAAIAASAAFPADIW
jgi:prepilin peptidase CpaA